MRCVSAPTPAASDTTVGVGCSSAKESVASIAFNCDAATLGPILSLKRPTTSKLRHSAHSKKPPLERTGSTRPPSAMGSQRAGDRSTDRPRNDLSATPTTSTGWPFTFTVLPRMAVSAP